MLGKLIKHDFKSTGKVFFPISILLVVISLFGSLLLGTKLLQREELLPLSITLLIAYILVLLSISTITGIYLIVYFYRNLFSAQGYLSFTLPTSPWSLLHAKTIVGFVWYILISILSFASAFLLVFSASGYENFKTVMQEFFRFQTSVTPASEGAASLTIGFADIFGYTPTQFIVIIIVLMICSGFYAVSMGYACVTLGQLYAKHKVVGTVLAYMALQVIVQIVSGIVIMFISLRPLLNISSVVEEVEVLSMMQSIYKPMFPALIFIYAVIGVICYIVSGIIMNKKVNLD